MSSESSDPIRTSPARSPQIPQPEHRQDPVGVAGASDTATLGRTVFLGNGLTGRPPGLFTTLSTMPQPDPPINLRSLPQSAVRSMSLFPANGTWERRAFSGIGGAVREHHLMGWRELWVRDDFFAGKTGRGQSWGCKTRGNLRECQTTAAATSGRLQKAPMSPESQAPDCQGRRVNW